MVAGAIAFAQDSFVVAEDGSPIGIPITLMRSGGSDGKISCTFKTATAKDTPATSGQDYRAVKKTVTWEDGDTLPKVVAVEILQDTSLENIEQIKLAIEKPTGGATLGLANATLLIEDDDSPVAISTTSDRFEITNVSTLILAANKKRRDASICNIGDSAVWLRRGAAAEVERGKIIYPEGAYEINALELWKGEVYAIAPLGSTSVLVVEEAVY